MSKKRGSIAVVVREDRFLVIRRSRHVVAPLMYCFPGGGIESGESEQETLVREMREELSVAIQPVRRIWRSVTPWHVELAWWLGGLDESEQIVPNPEEVESVHWFTAAEMLAMDDLLESNRHFLAALAAGEFCVDVRP